MKTQGLHPQPDRATLPSVEVHFYRVKGIRMKKLVSIIGLVVLVAGCQRGPESPVGPSVARRDQITAATGQTTPAATPAAPEVQTYSVDDARKKLETDLPSVLGQRIRIAGKVKFVEIEGNRVHVTFEGTEATGFQGGFGNGISGKTGKPTSFKISHSPPDQATYNVEACQCFFPKDEAAPVKVGQTVTLEGKVKTIRRTNRSGDGFDLPALVDCSLVK
jgi:hypothetical protein